MILRKRFPLSLARSSLVLLVFAGCDSESPTDDASGVEASAPSPSESPSESESASTPEVPTPTDPAGASAENGSESTDDPANLGPGDAPRDPTPDTPVPVSETGGNGGAPDGDQGGSHPGGSDQGSSDQGSSGAGGMASGDIPDVPTSGAGGEGAEEENGGGGSGGNTAMGGDGGSTMETAGAGGGGAEDLPVFSFFVTSYAAITRLSGSPDGFGGDLRYGEATGLEGADKICNEVAEASMPGSSTKGWRAFLSVVSGPDGEQVDAIDRIGTGPWYDRAGRIVAMTLDDLAQTRPNGADPQIIDDLPNEDGIGNHSPDGTPIDNHHVLTGSDEEGRLYGPTATCADWTSTEMSADGRPRIGFSWPAMGREHWISGQDEGGCLAGIDIDGGGGSDPSVGTVGSGGGYGGIYCFALTP